MTCGLDNKDRCYYNMMKMKLMEEIILTSFIKLNQIQVIQNNSKIWKIYHNNKTKINYLTKIFI